MRSLVRLFAVALVGMITFGSMVKAAEAPVTLRTRQYRLSRRLTERLRRFWCYLLRWFQRVYRRTKRSVALNGKDISQSSGYQSKHSHISHTVKADATRWPTTKH
jgi:hypothetical protein